MEGYNFNPEEFPKITLHLVIEALAFQQAAVSVIVEKLNLSESEKDDIVKQINNLIPSLKETILSSLYESFGKTPDV